mgnify:CR=1 FL=1
MSASAEIERRLEEQESLLEIGVALAETLQPRQVLETALAKAEALCAAETSSIWELDESTGELMANFYRALDTSKGDRPDALREAKLSLLRMQKGTAKPFAQPWHWSSFQLYGDYRSPGLAK